MLVYVVKVGFSSLEGGTESDSVWKLSRICSAAADKTMRFQTAYRGVSVEQGCNERRVFVDKEIGSVLGHSNLRTCGQEGHGKGCGRGEEYQGYVWQTAIGEESDSWDRL